MQSDNKILVEVHPIKNNGVTRSGSSPKIVEKTTEEMEKIVETSVKVAQNAIQKISKMDHKPDEIQIKFGIKVTGEAGIVFAKASTEGNFEFTITWKRAEIDNS